MNDFGGNLKELRINQKYTQEQLAKKLNKTKSTISCYESGQKQPSLQTLIEIAKIFHTSLDNLLGLDKKKTIVIDDLSSAQIELLNSLVIEFRSTPIQNKKRLSLKQLELLGDLMFEFQKL